MTEENKIRDKKFNIERLKVFDLVKLPQTNS